MREACYKNNVQLKFWTQEANADFESCTEDYKGVSGNSAMTRGNTAVTPSDPNITPSRHGNIHTKYRKMIVVACHDRVRTPYDSCAQNQTKYLFLNEQKTQRERLLLTSCV
jgi:hypothetical protein